MFLGAGHQENDGFVGTPRQTGGVFNHLISFVLVDGWSLVTGSLIQSYGT
jgi:hypothetical protein